MSDALQPQTTAWSLLQKILFRFFFVYLLLCIAPWSWLNIIPGVDYLLNFYYDFIEWAVIKANANFFQVFGVKNVRQVFNGSGDTSFSWAETCLYLSIAFIGCVVWSLLDRRSNSYRQLNYLLCLLTRYSIALIAFSYGFQKIFALQMPFPLLSYMATPLGDFLPMRFSWIFIGYSTPYQIFSGAMEVLVGVLLLWRRTATMGVLVATAVFINVMMLNLCYDIPVKLYSMNIVLMCLYLLANEYNRIACFFVLNKPAPLCSIYNFRLTRKWMRVTRIILKLVMIFMVGQSLYGCWKGFKHRQVQVEIKPIQSGVYDVTRYAVNNDTLPAIIADSIRWQDVIFEKGGIGSVNTADTIFRQRYGRGYFFFTADTINQVIHFKKFPQDSLFIIYMHYKIPDNNTIQLWGRKQNDSLYVELKKSKRHFQLGERQFHWLSEANR